MSRLFISYQRADAEFSNDLRRKLKANRHRAWIDTLSIAAGTEWRREIDQAIRSSDAVLVVLSRNSVHSEYVNYEWAFALGARIPVIPLLLDNTQAPEPLREIQCIDVSATNPQPWVHIRKALALLRRRRQATSEAQQPRKVAKRPPRLVARFQLDDKRRPIRIPDSDEYALEVFLKNVPASTRRVRYELLDESYIKPRRNVTDAHSGFTEEVYSYGDVAITAKGFERPGGPVSWTIEGQLYKALRVGHARALNPPIRKALKDILTN